METNNTLKKENRNIKLYIITAVFVAVLLIIQFIAHRITPFMRDDIWYATNLVTGEKVKSLGDIIESQIWHYFNWGGRSINHALLQVVLATGEVAADVLNILATIILGFVIFKTARAKNPLMYLLCEALIVAFNASLFFSMLWESGSVNYLYSTSWILLYVLVILKEMDFEVEKASKAGIAEYLWIIPLALIAGWSTENMGPTCFVLTVGVIIFLAIKKKKIPFYLYEGAFLTLVGSALLILAPGNFVRNQFVEKAPFMSIIKGRIDSFLLSGCGFLLTSFLFAIILLVIQIYIIKEIKPRDIALFAFAVIAQGAMFLSPAYPQRASFGIMCVLITYIVSVISRLYDNHKKMRPMLILLTSSFVLYAIIKICSEIIFPAV
ncbi:MAG: hypothetical protein IKS56_06360 [Lachnospiraceae bacterium]|nr:hypothetical protein [Lachnospiraceae bacterium]